MRCETQRLLISFCVAAVFSVFSTAASALIEVCEGNNPVENMGWPNGAEEVANLPERLGYRVGPPFGGGEYYFRFPCESTERFNEALRRFGAIRTPRIGREFLSSLDGRRARVADAKPFLLVVHDRPKAPPEDRRAREAGEDRARVDWTFTIWNPEAYHRLFSNPKGLFASNHPHYRQPVPPPRIDVYLSKGGPIEWKEVKVPDNVRVIDMRSQSAPVNVRDGGVVRGAVYDTGTHQGVVGAKVALIQRTERRVRKQAASAQTGENGLFHISAVPQGYYEVHVLAEGYAGRKAGVFDNRSGHAYLEFDTLISRRASLKGVVVDDKGNPIPGVKVSARNTVAIDGLGYQCASEPVATTDAKGGFEISSLPEGFTGMRCRAPALHQKTSIFELYRVSSRPWEERADVKIVMTGTGVVRGKVVGKDGKAPTRSFVVNLEPKGGSRIGTWGGSMQCDEGGAFEFKGVPPGEYVLIAQPNPMTKGEASEPRPVVVTTAGVLEVEIVNDHAGE